MTDKISKHAVIDPSAKIAANVEIGPWSYIGADVEIGEGTVIGSNVVLKGPTKIGKENRIFQFCSIGEDTQDMKYAGEQTFLEIGDRNTFREYVSIHRGTTQDNSLTKIGNDNLFITYSHVGHDCVIGDFTIIGHHAGLAGHVKVDDYAILSSYAGVHQFCHVGPHAFIARATMLTKDLPPYMMAAGGDNAKAVNINSEGLKRRGYTPEAIAALRRAYKVVYRNGLTAEQAKDELIKMAAESKEVQVIVDFINASTRGILR